MVIVKTKQQFKDAILTEKDEIRIENPKLAKWVLIIISSKPLAWYSVIGTLTAAALTSIPTSGASILIVFAVGGIALTSAFKVLGILGSIGKLNSLKNDYRVAEKEDSYIVLKKRERQ